MDNITFGLNISLGHIGWTVIDTKMNRILNSGLRKFQIPELPKEKITLAAVRRETKSKRKTNRRKKTRMKLIKNEIINVGLLDIDTLSKLFNNKETREDVHKLRYKGLDYKLTNTEWSRVLIFLAKHRSYKSISKEERIKEYIITESQDNKAVTSNSESGKVLIALQENKRLFLDSGYRTVGELINCNPKFSNKIRNTTDDYSRMFHRNFIVEEIKTLFECQRKLGNTYASKDFEDRILSIMLFQKPFTTREMIENNAGECTLIKGEQRYAKNTYTFEYFTLLQKINSLKINDEFLDDEQRSTIVLLAYKNVNVTYGNIRKELNLNEDDRFNFLNYGLNDIKKVEKVNFITLKFYHTIRKAISSYSKEIWESISGNKDILDDLGYGITTCKYEDELADYLKDRVDSEILESIKLIEFSGFGHISKKALDKIIPYLEQGDIYSVACDKAGLDFRGHSIYKELTYKLPTIHLKEVKNTKMHRLYSEYRKLFNNLIDKYGIPNETNIIIDKQLSMAGVDRNKLIGVNKKNEKEYEKIKADFFNEFKINPNVKDLIRYRLWKEQSEKDIFTDEVISKSDFFNNQYVVTDILDERLSLNSSISNKILVNKHCVEDKGIKTFFELMDEDEVKYSDFVKRILDSDLLGIKKVRLLKRKITNKDLKKWQQISTIDNCNGSQALFNLISLNTKVKTNLYTSSLVNYLRSCWHLPNDKKNIYSEYLPSIILAAIDSAYVKNMITCAKRVLNGENLPKSKCFPMKYYYFKDEVLAYISINRKANLRILTDNYKLGDIYSYSDIEKMTNFMPSIKCNHSINGKIHPDTIRSKRCTKIPLQKLTFSNIGYNKNTKEVTQIYNYGSDRYTYDAIIDRLVEFDGNGAKAFKEPFYKVSKKGHGQEIKSIKVISNYNGVEVNNGITNSANQLRIDIYNVNGKYQIVPIYRNDIFKEKLPNIAIGTKQLKMDDKDFVYSLYSQDTIMLKKEGSDVLGIYKSVDRSTGSMSIEILNNGTIEAIRVAINKIEDIRKINIGILGDYNIVNKEKRQYFNNMKR